ncbi:hypothetical protein Tco_1132033 [Tanacetum coccineum]|uniref:Uncharacterized protein n=1 Tax=Tanacetum coccineum TaxID=301880 RepID=A0ABQ5JAQ4_9ASTR
MQMVGGNGGNPFRQYSGQNVGNQVVQNAVQNLGVQNVGNQNGVIVVPGIAYQNGNEARIQLQAKEFDLMATAADLDEIEEVNASCILMANLHSGKQIMALNEEISNLNKQLSKEKSTVSSLQEEKKRLKSDFKIREDELLDKQIQLENKIHKIVKDENFPIINQVDARVQNFKIQFLKEATKFVQEFQPLANEADESLAKHKAVELEIERLLRAVVNQDIMSIVQNNYVVDTSNLQTELDHTKERFENCIIKKENEYAKLWNDWYKKCEECKYDKISHDKAYNDMQQKIERLQARLGDQKGKSKDTPCVSDTLDPVFQKLENENLFDSINVTRTQTETIIDSFQNKSHDMIYENAKLRVQLFDKVSEQKDTTRGTSENTKFTKQSILGIPPSSSRPKLYDVTPLPKYTAIPKVGETNALSNQVTSNSVPSSQEIKVVENDNVISPGMFRIDPHNTSRENKFVPIHNVRASTSLLRPEGHSLGAIQRMIGSLLRPRVVALRIKKLK